MEDGAATLPTEPETSTVPVYGITRYETLILEAEHTHETERDSLTDTLNEYGQQGYKVAGVLSDGCIILQRPTVGRVA